jgi:hypothetical protein
VEVCGLPAQTRTVVHDLGRHLHGGVVEEDHGRLSARAHERVEEFYHRSRRKSFRRNGETEDGTRGKQNQALRGWNRHHPP